MYEQTLYKVLDNYIKPNIIKQKNRHNKWEYGYNKDHDVVVISRTGKIGEIYEIQNLKIALPLIENAYKRSDKKEEQYWVQEKYPKELSKIKMYLIGINIRTYLKRNGMIISIKNLNTEKKGLLFIIMVNQHI
jgi:hypothetical protein